MSPAMRNPGILILVLAALVGTAEAARTYKWVDEDGVTHYSQYPPRDTEAEIIKPNISLPSSTTSDSAAQDSAKVDQAEGNGDDAEARTMGAYCDQLREQAKLLASERNVSVRNDDGTLKALEGDDRAAQRAEVEYLIEQHCS